MIRALPLVVTGVIGAIVGTALGFVVFRTTVSYGFAFSMFGWIRTYPMDALPWTIGGVIVAMGALYVWNSNSN